METTNHPLNARIFSSGNGVQSVAVIILIARGILQYDEVIFANVGDDSENPDTLTYYRDVIAPYCMAHKIKLTEVRKPGLTLYEYAIGENRTIPLPVYMSSGAPGTRICTVDWKILPIAKYLRTSGRRNVTVALGISIDEAERAKDTQPYKIAGIWQRREYPLLDARMTRMSCLKLISDEGLPPPPKSSCWFCPYKNMKAWQEMRNNKPELFERAVNLENRLNAKREHLGKDNVYLTRRLMPLREAVNIQMSLPYENEFCESGYCLT